MRVHELSQSYKTSANQYNLNNQLGVLLAAPPFVLYLDVMREEDQGLTSHSSTKREDELIFISSLLAISVNYLATYLLAETSPLTYQVIGAHQSNPSSTRIHSLTLEFILHIDQGMLRPVSFSLWHGCFIVIQKARKLSLTLTQTPVD